MLAPFFCFFFFLFLKPLFGHYLIAPSSSMSSHFVSFLYFFWVVAWHSSGEGGNILLNKDGIVKLGDFGLCAVLEHGNRQTQVGSPFWMSPELITGEGYNHKVQAAFWHLVCTVHVWTLGWLHLLMLLCKLFNFYAFVTVFSFWSNEKWELLYLQYKVDIWALGITILEMTDYEHPFFEKNPMTVRRVLAQLL